MDSKQQCLAEGELWRFQQNRSPLLIPVAIITDLRIIFLISIS